MFECNGTNCMNEMILNAPTKCYKMYDRYIKCMNETLLKE